MNREINLILDPGHGGLDDNGRYLTHGKSFLFPNGDKSYEGVFNRNIAKILGDILKSKGFNVVYTVPPESPSDPSLLLRVMVANQFDKDSSCFISIHNNAAPTPGTARGFEIFTSKGRTKADELALAIFDSVKPLYDSLGIPMRADMSDGDSDKEADFYVLNKTEMPAVLMEILFFDNETDYKLLTDSLFLNSVSTKIADGIEKYIKTNN